MSNATTSTLTEFLLARIAEDEAVARDAAVLAETPWLATYGRQVETARDGYLVTPEDEHSYSNDPTDAVSQHIARHDPARVLTECESKRRIVEAHPLTTDVVPVWTGSTPGYACDNCARLSKADPKSIVEDIGACDTLAALAAVYADHPDYDESWRH